MTVIDPDDVVSRTGCAAEEMPRTRRRGRTFGSIGSIAIALAACGDDDRRGDGTSPATDANEVVIAATDDLRWDPDVVTVTAGVVTIHLRCEGGMAHALGIDEDEIVACEPGEEATATIELEAGSHEFVCLIPGHDQMRGTIEVA